MYGFVENNTNGFFFKGSDRFLPAVQKKRPRKLGVKKFFFVSGRVCNLGGLFTSFKLYCVCNNKASVVRSVAVLISNDLARFFPNLRVLAIPSSYLWYALDLSPIITSIVFSIFYYPLFRNMSTSDVPLTLLRCYFPDLIHKSSFWRILALLMT